MLRPAFDDETADKPLDPSIEKVRRKLVRFVAVNIGLLALALMAVVGALVYKSRSTAGIAAPAPPAAVAEGTIPLPAGARLLSQALSGNRLSLEVELADGGRSILLYDLAEGRIVGRFAVSAQ